MALTDASRDSATGVFFPSFASFRGVCFKASWIMNVLHSGFGFSCDYRKLHPIDKLAGTEVQWSLGALIYQIQSPEFQKLLTQGPNSSTGSFTRYRPSEQSHYAIIVDAGSSGSRLFVYCIPAHKKSDDPLPPITLCLDGEGKPLTKKINPGLSSFASDPSSAQAYISGLLSIAAHNIPREFHSLTPVYVFATAGMRFLTESQQDAIWRVVRSTIKKEFIFKFEESWAQTVSGLFEALYGWITVNYLLGNFVEPPHPTVGMLDMGGASMQIAYEVPPDLSPPKDLILPFTIGDSRTYNVYVMTFLGYGTHAAESRYKSSLLHNAMEYSEYSSLLRLRYRPSTGYVKLPKLTNLTVQLHYTTKGEEKFIISDPCLQSDLESTLNARDLVISRTIRIPGDSPSPIVTFLGTGDMALCVEYQKNLLQKQKTCQLQPCSMNGIHQPPVNFDATSFYAISEYWYTSADLGTTVSDTYTFDTFSSSALAMCKTPWHSSLKQYQAQNVDPSDIFNKQALCFKASWIMNVLHSGFGFSRDYHNLHPIDKLAGIEVQWSLGAFIYQMQSPEFQELLTQGPNSSSMGSFTQRRSVAVFFLFLFVVFALLMYCIYCRRRQPARFDLGGTGGSSSILRPLKRLFPRSSKVMNNGSAIGIPTPTLSGFSSGFGNKRTSTGNYHYSKIASPSLQVNFRPSTSMPTLEALEDGSLNGSPMNNV
ncbi:hypothetical protein Aperf_G00000084102 [Anoplocephala perfoliata]